MSSSGSAPTTPNDQGYPEQRHAGEVGYGPNYNTSSSMMDKISGLTAELHGKITHKPDLVREGHDKRTGESKRRKALGLDEKDPFAIPGEEDTKSQAESQTSTPSTAAQPSPSSTVAQRGSPCVSIQEPGSTPTQSAKESSTGSKSFGGQRRGEANSTTPRDSD